MIVAVMMVRNEADVLRVNVLHHLAAGVDRFLVLDDGSTDGTGAVLEALATQTGRVEWRRREGPFLQAEATTALAREAYALGARWVLPVDADELWYAPAGSLRDVLDSSSAGALEVEIVTFVQSRSQERAEPAALLGLTRRPPAPVGSLAEGPDLVESGRIAFVEMRYPPKYVSRATIALEIAQGNHAVRGIGGPVERTAAIVCLHAPLRAREVLESRKVDHGRRIEEVDAYLRQAWHVRRWRRLAAEGRLAEEWAANSWRDDRLDVGGEAHPLVEDGRFRDLAAPWLDERAPLPRPREEAGLGPDPAPDETAAIVERVRPLEGWLREEEAALLVRAARRAVVEQPEPEIVEIGSFCGKSTVALALAARAARAASRIHAIDPHEGEVGAADSRGGLGRQAPTLERFRANLAEAGVSDAVEPVVRRSEDVAWRRPIAMLFVDGLHDYASVVRDFRRFEEWLGAGAYLAFHDCDANYPGVQACVAGAIESGAYRFVERAHSLVLLRKQAAGDPDRTAVRLAQQDRGIAFLIREIADRERTIAERDRGIEWLRGVVAAHEAAIAERDRGIEWLRRELEERESRIRALEAAAGERADAAREAGAPRQLVVEARTVSPAGGLRGHLDAPAACGRLPGCALDVAGWALDASGRASEVALAGTNVAVLEGPAAADRPDVAAAFPDAAGAGRSGFRARVAVPAPGPFELRVEAASGGERAVLASVRGRRAEGDTVVPWGLVLLYHRVADVEVDPWSLAVSPARFAEHLEVLARLARPVSLRRLLDEADAGGPPPGTVALTFDDGYADFLTDALPALERRGIPATLFVATGGLDAPAPFWWDDLAARLLCGDPSARRWRAGEPPATEAQARYLREWRRLRPLPDAERRRELARLGDGGAPSGRGLGAGELARIGRHDLVEIGSHGVEHRRLADLAPDEQRREIADSRRELEERTGRRVSGFAYPFGAPSDVGPETARLVAEAGYEQACLNAAGVVDRDTDRWRLPRLYVEDWDGDELARRLRGWLGG